MSKKKSYVQVGIGGRSFFFTKALIEDFRDHCELLAICDSNQGRMDYCNRHIEELGCKAVKTFPAEQFEQMIALTKPDSVIITTGPDVTHSDYITRAMELGCDVITEKPMTTDEVRCRKILETIDKTGRDLKVTFNYRYSPPRSQIKEMLMEGVIGDILSINFAWMLDTRHGADYFRRWHRKRENSGSLLVHKSTHHFDLINWMLDDVPEEVFCQASLAYYTPQTGDRMGLQGRGERCLGCPVKEKCKFYFDLKEHREPREMYLDCEQYDDYFRDRCVFSDEIDIWDNMSVSVRYRRGAIFSYLLNAYSPYEGYFFALNGTKGRLEHFCNENTYVSGDGTVPGALTETGATITLIPEFSKAQEIRVRTGGGGHGGGDPLLLADIFDPNAPADPLGRKAGQRDGAYSILIGAAACKSADSGKMVRVSDLLGNAPL